MLAGPPDEAAVPGAVARFAAGRATRAVWRNLLGGLTFEVGTGADRCFVKWAAAGSGADLAGEAERMRWLGAHGRGPTVLDLRCTPDGDLLVTSPLPGESAVSPRWRGSAEAVVRAVGAGLRAFHDATPIERCPWRWDVEDRVALAHRRANAGETDPARWHEEHRTLTLDGALAQIDAPPSIDHLVVCHGDACSPNSILDRVGGDLICTGHVDLGAVAIADRWADLAIATWSATWNFGPGLEDLLLEAYGVDPDPVRTAYHRLLWDLT